MSPAAERVVRATLELRAVRETIPMSFQTETEIKTGDPCEVCGTSYVECTKRVLAPGGRSCCSRCLFTDTHAERAETTPTPVCDCLTEEGS
jgi:hypothetical protein